MIITDEVEMTQQRSKLFIILKQRMRTNMILDNEGRVRFELHNTRVLNKLINLLRINGSEVKAER